VIVLAQVDRFFALGRRKPGQKPGGAWLASPWFWVATMILSFGVPLYRSFTVPKPPPLPVLGTLESFTALNQDGLPFSSQEQLRGAVTVMQVISSSSEDKDNLAALEGMSRFQNRVLGVGNSVRLISFGADPVRDTPAALRELGLRLTARFRQWTFLSGPLPTSLLRLEPMPGEYFLIDQLGQVRRRGSLAEITPPNKGMNFWIRDLAFLVNAYTDSTPLSP